MILADVIAKRTNWPFLTFVDEYGEPRAHAFILTPNNTFLDVTGEWDMEEFADKWGFYGGYWEEMPEYEDWFTFGYAWGDYDTDRARAEEIADTLISRVELGACKLANANAS